MTYPGLFKNYDLKGSQSWLKRLAVDDLRAFVQIGLEAADHGRMGGKARAAGAQRDRRGRFVKCDGTNKVTGVDPVKGTANDPDAWS